MSTLYIIAGIVAAICIVSFFFQLIAVIERETTTLSLNYLVVAILLIALMYVAKVEHKNGYNVGYQQAITDAELISWDHLGYDIQFNGELHSYEWDGTIYFEGNEIHK